MSTPQLSSAEGAKFCVDCNSIATSPQGWQNFKCLHTNNIHTSELNLVTGDQIRSYKAQNCTECRNNEALCGKTAKWFVPAPKFSDLKLPEPKPARKSGISADDL